MMPHFPLLKIHDVEVAKTKRKNIVNYTEFIWPNTIHVMKYTVQIFFFFSNKSCRWKRFNESDYISTRFHIFDVINGNIHVFMWHFIIVHSYINHQSVQFVCIEKHQLRNYEITRRFWGGKYEWNCCNRFMLQMVTDGKLFLFHAEW